MKVIRVSEGKYSEVKLENGKRVFISVLPDRITASTMLLTFPRQKIWEYEFPFHIRTALAAWDSSKEVLSLTLEAIKGAKHLDELLLLLENDASKVLRDYVDRHGDEARQISVDKVGRHALRQMLKSAMKESPDFVAIINEYGEVLERAGTEDAPKYPTAVYPQSLLPYPKEAIKEALETALCSTQDESMKESLKVDLVLLDAFVEDAEANRQNSAMLEAYRLAEDLRKRRQHE